MRILSISLLVVANNYEDRIRLRYWKVTRVWSSARSQAVVELPIGARGVPRRIEDPQWRFGSSSPITWLTSGSSTPSVSLHLQGAPAPQSQGFSG